MYRYKLHRYFPLAAWTIVYRYMNEDVVGPISKLKNFNKRICFKILRCLVKLAIQENIEHVCDDLYLIKIGEELKKQ